MNYLPLPWKRAEVELHLHIVVEPEYQHMIGPEWHDGRPTITIRPDVEPEALGAVVLGAIRQQVKLDDE